MKRTAPILLLIFSTLSCTDFESKRNIFVEKEKLQTENDSFKNVLMKNKYEMRQQITTFLTFQENNAEEAMNFYIELFDDSEIIEIKRYGKDEPAKEGTIMKATFELNGKQFICSDSYIKHAWTFTPAVSNFVECETDKELENLFEKLSKNGKVMMPLDNYGFSKKFGFVEDQFGISWQLNLQ